MLSTSELTKNCRVCGNEFTKHVNNSVARWKKRELCSRKCANESFRGVSRNNPTVFKPGQTAGDKNAKWKGDGASYAAKHMWVKYHFGRASECEDCGVEDRKVYHWANISKMYLRERTDWKQLCVPCHKAFDLSRINK